MIQDKDLAFLVTCENEGNQLSNEDMSVEFLELLFRPRLKEIPYKLIVDKEIPLTPLMKFFLFIFDFCCHRYVDTDFYEYSDVTFDYDRFNFLLHHEFGLEVRQEKEWSMENMKALMLRVESEITPEYRERLKEKWEDIKEIRQMFFDLINLCSQSKRLTIISNVAFADINFDMLNKELYSEYGIYLSMVDRMKLDYVGKMVNHILFRLYDGRYRF